MNACKLGNDIGYVFVKTTDFIFKYIISPTLTPIANFIEGFFFAIDRKEKMRF